MAWARTNRDIKERQLRQLYEQFIDTWKMDKEHGSWVKVEPYQRGWTRVFTLRDDIKNRDDVADIRQVLHMVNTKVFCRNEDFLHYDWKQKKDVPIEQHPRKLMEEQYNALTEKQQSYFSKTTVIETRTFPFHKKEMVVRYEVKNPFWYVFLIEPNMIEYHWHPDPEWESHCAEITHKIDRENLWPKINKMLGASTHYHRGWKPDAWMRNKSGEVMTYEGYEPEEVV